MLSQIFGFNISWTLDALRYMKLHFGCVNKIIKNIAMNTLSPRTAVDSAFHKFRPYFGTITTHFTVEQ